MIVELTSFVALVSQWFECLKLELQKKLEYSFEFRNILLSFDVKGVLELVIRPLGKLTFAFIVLTDFFIVLFMPCITGCIAVKSFIYNEKE